MSELFGTNLDLQEEQTKRLSKPKTKKQKQTAKAHTHGTKIKVETINDEFKSSDDSIIGEEVMLFDMGVMETSKFLQDSPKPKNIRTTKPSAFGNQTKTLRRSTKKKKPPKKPKTDQQNITDITIPEDCRVYEFAEKLVNQQVM